MIEPYVQEVTIDNVVKMEMKKVLKALEPHCLELVPEGIIENPDGVKIIDRLIGRFANLYVYMMFLYGHLNSEAQRLKLIGDDDESVALTRKKDAIFELARGVHYKQEACSRMLTALLREVDDDQILDRPNHEGRRKAEEARRGPKTMSGWNAVGGK